MKINVKFNEQVQAVFEKFERNGISLHLVQTSSDGVYVTTENSNWIQDESAARKGVIGGSSLTGHGDTITQAFLDLDKIFKETAEGEKCLIIKTMVDDINIYTAYRQQGISSIEKFGTVIFDGKNQMLNFDT